MTNPMTTTGDIIVASNTATPATPARLGITAPAANALNVIGITNAETTPTYKALLDTTSPSTQAFGDAASAGTSLKAAHIDHKHAMPANPVSGTINEIAYLASASTVGSLAVATYPSLTELSYVKGVTSAIQTQLNAKGAGTVTAVSVATANGISGSSSGGATPALTLTLGAITPTTVNALTLASQTNGFTIAGGTTSKTLTVPLDASVSGTNTGDQTLPVKISGTTLDALTDDTGFVTAKAIQDGHKVPHVAPGTAGNVCTSDGTDWISSVPAASGTSLWTAITGTRASNTTITVATDLTAIFKKGMIVRWQESAVDKVAMVSIPSTYGSPNTTITIIGDTCASIDANSFKYSVILGAEPYIARFAIAGNIGAISTDVSNAYYAIEPMRVIGADLQAGTAGTTNNTTIDINIEGTTSFTTKPTLATTVVHSATPFTADTAKELALNDRVSIDIDAFQTTNAIDLYVQLYLFPTRFLTLS